MNSNILRFC